MDNKNEEKKTTTLSEEQAARAAETLINAWLRNDDNDNPKTNKSTK